MDAAHESTVPGSAVDLSALAPALQRGADGLWYSLQDVPPTESDPAPACWFAVEDQAHWFHHRTRLVIEMVRRFPPPGPIFDIGGGAGVVSRGLNSVGFPSVVVEPRAASARLAASRGLSPVVCATLEGAGFRPGSLAAVGLFHVLEHQQDDRAMLESLARLVTLGGRLYLTAASHPPRVGHGRGYTRRGLRRLVEAAGFTINTDTCLFAPLSVLPAQVGLPRPDDPWRRQGGAPPRGPGEALLTSLLDLETWWLTHVGPVPIGTSCLLVATRR